jgi:lincosamide nucleotidyltransferase A/C/D/E
MMRASDVVGVVDQLEAAGVSLWVAGGWGIDALLASDSRPHKDLDLLVSVAQLPTVEETLKGAGFERDDESELPAFLILRDSAGRQVDLYLVHLDSAGNAWQSFSTRKWDHFSADELEGRGKIGNRSVRCLSAQAQFRQFLGYEWGDNAIHDLAGLQRKFGVPLPPDLA